MEILNGLHYVVFILIGVNYLLFGLLVNAISFLLWLTIRPLNKGLYRKFIYYATYINWGQLVFIPEWLSSSTIIIYTDEETWSKLGTESAIAVFNHSYEVDWVFVLFMCEAVRILGNAKALVKKSLKWAPVVGWTAQFGESIFLERNWEKDKVNMEKQLNSLSHFSDPFWLTLFAEGTRYTAEKYKASVEFAKKTGITPLKHLLLPRTKGFILAVQQMRNKVPAVYSCTMTFNTKEGSPSFKSLLFGRPATSEVFIERIPIEDVPEDPVQAADWLHESYRQRDQLIDIYKKEGKFPDTWPASRYLRGPIQAHYRPRRLYLLLIALGSSMLTLPPIGRAIYSLLCSGLLNLSLAIILLGLVYVALVKMMELSSASKGSTYGSDSLRSKST